VIDLGENGGVVLARALALFLLERNGSPEAEPAAGAE
jgi:hypothetical protein